VQNGRIWRRVLGLPTLAEVTAAGAGPVAADLDDDLGWARGWSRRTDIQYPGRVRPVVAAAAW